MSDEKNDMIKLSGLWINESKGGKKYMAGTLTPTCRLMMFKNEHKQKDSEPDYNLYMVPYKKKDRVEGFEQTNDSQSGMADIDKIPF